MDLTVQLECVSFSYHEGDRLIDEVSLSVRAGEIVYVTGPNGCGKTTLLKIASLLLPPLSGEIFISGGYVNFKDAKEVRKVRSNFISLSPQEPFFPLNLTVLEQLEFLRINLHRAKRLLEMFNIEDKIFSYPFNLSGGQRKKLAHVIALAKDAAVYVLDEPFAYLDGNSIEALVTTVMEYQKNGKSFLIASPDVKIVSSDSASIYTLIDGKLQEEHFERG